MPIERKADGLYAIHIAGVTCHALANADGVVLIDTGLIGGLAHVRRLFRLLGRRREDLRAILITHGHLDHTGGLEAIRRWSGAPAYAHPEEQIHIDGAYAYRGWARVGGGLERVGRWVTRYRPVRIDRHIADEEELPFWGGLRAMHLPGHTQGHVGFYGVRRDVLFAGDLFASYLGRTHRPPAIFNSDADRLRASLERVRRLDPAEIYVSHYDRWLRGSDIRRRYVEHLRGAPVDRSRTEERRKAQGLRELGAQGATRPSDFLTGMEQLGSNPNLALREHPRAR